MSQDLQIRVTATADTQAATGGVQQLNDATARIVPAAEAAGRGMQTLTADAYQLAQSMTRAKQAAADWSANYAVEIEAASRADMAQFARMAATTQTAERAAGALNQTRTASSNASLGILELSRAFEDAQYGLRGVLNNIPMMLTLFGFSGGLAGAVSIAAVSVDMLVRSMGDAEKETNKLASATRDAVHAAAEKAAKSAAAAAAAERESAAEKDLAAEIEALEESYASLVTAQDDSAAASERQMRASRALREALKEQALEQIRLEEQGGKIDGVTAAKRRGEMERGSMDETEAERAAAAAKKKADLDARAAAAEEEAKRLRETASKIESAGPPPLSEKERAAAADRKAQLEAELKDASRQRTEATTPLKPGFFEDIFTGGVSMGETEEEAANRKTKLENATKRQAEIIAALKEAEEKAAADAQRRTAQQQAKAEEARKLAEQREAEAKRLRGESADVASEDATAAKVYEVQSRTQGMRTGGEIERAEEQRRQKDEREAERLLREKKKQDKAELKDAKEIAGLADTGRELAARAEAAGAKDSGVQALEAAIRTLESGGSNAALLRVVASLEKWALTHNQRLAALADKFEAQLKNR